MGQNEETSTQPQDVDLRRVLGAGMIGNVLEWYDFALYGFMAHYIAASFFPSSDPLSSLLAAYGAFAAGFLARPIGALIFGHIGDQVSRKAMLTISILLMGVGTTSIGFLPTYDQVGPLAGVLLVIIRILQGISVGGELSGSIVFIAELAPERRRGLLSSVPQFGSFVGYLAGSGFAALLSVIFSDAQMQDGFWRVAFLSGSVIMVLGILLRSRLEIPEREQPDLGGMSPARIAITQHWREILRVAGISVSSGVAFYIMFAFGVTFLTDQVGITPSAALDLNTIALVVAMMMCLVGGYMNDIFRFKPMFLILNLCILVTTYPLFLMFDSGVLPAILFSQIVFAIGNGLSFGATSAAIVTLAPHTVRATVVSIGYNLTYALFGGTAPAVATYLIKRTENDMVPAYYMMVFSVVAIVTTFLLPKGVSTLRGKRDVT